MIINKACSYIVELQRLRYNGGKHYKEASRLLNAEPTTDNIQKIIKFIQQIKEKHDR